MTKGVVALAAFASLVTTAADAADIVGVRGRKLTAVAGDRLVIVARDPGVVLLPDPGTTGATLTVTHGGADGTLPLPAGVEWSTTPGTKNRYRNPAAPGGPSPCGTVVVRNGGVLRAVCRGLGGFTLPASGDIEVTLSDGSGVDQVMCFAADVNDGTRLVAKNPESAAGRCPMCRHATSVEVGSVPLFRPFDTATDGAGNVYVADFGNGLVQKFDSTGAFLTSWDTGSTQVTGVAVDGSGNVYTSEYHRVQKFDGVGTLLDSWGTFGSANGEFIGPEGIATDGSGNVFVSDTQNYRIQKFDGAGNFIAAWGTLGSGNGQFMFAHGVATDASGNVYVADGGNNRIQKFDNSGAFLGTWGSPGTATGRFDSPYGIATDGAGNVYVADTFNHRIQVFDGTGAFVKAWGRSGARTSQFNRPFGVTVDASGDVWVADGLNDRLQKFDCP